MPQACARSFSERRAAERTNNMNLLVFSDSHGRTSKLLEAFSRQIKKPDAVIFLGDGLRDISYCDGWDVPLLCVCGNCDVFNIFGSVNAEEEMFITLGGKRIMMTHGHNYSVKSTLTRLCMAAKRNDADIVLFGHTHQAFEQYLPAGETEYGVTLTKPLYLFNPGSIGDYESSFGCIEIDAGGRVLLSHGNL